MTTLPDVGMVTGVSGAFCQREAGAAGSLDPGVMAIVADVFILRWGCDEEMVETKREEKTAA